ncbi:T9SS type A sorting domain-containing protein [Sediminitomix flava]|uniref:Putative secreted protein (Por secretion system target) n=1 Tax=Sediminitomix flava TaxID=379075 RepID=A0A315Z9X8_SEDFL|nr:T9SS type A sorting domain-containing protein [Sediminitomix flava]PWJ42140.1 putative secreted protein (Por secretion system target) [Sediminitomix flava]
MIRNYQSRKKGLLFCLLLVLSCFSTSFASFPTVLTFSEIDTDLTFEVSPNPSSGDHIKLVIESVEEIDALEVIIYDTIGGIVFKELTQIGQKNEKTVFSISPKDKLTPGLYFLSLKTHDKKVTKRLIII